MNWKFWNTRSAEDIDKEMGAIIEQQYDLSVKMVHLGEEIRMLSFDDGFHDPEKRQKAQEYLQEVISLEDRQIELSKRARDLDKQLEKINVKD